MRGARLRRGPGEGDANTSGSNESNTFTSRAKPFVAQPAKEFDPRARYTFAFADVDGNGHNDSLVLDRTGGLLTVRLYGAFPAGHPYAGVDQKACTASFWKHNLSPSAANVNLDYCNAVVRPEESWGTVPIVDPSHDRIRLKKGRFSAGPDDTLLIWDEGQIVFARSKVGSDAIGKRPTITDRFSFDFSTIDLSRIDVCKLPDLHPAELEQCASDRWKNLARLWDGVAIGDLNGDGIDDIVGQVSLNDEDAMSQIGIWSLLSTRTASGVTWTPRHFGNMSWSYRGAPMFVGDFDGSGTKQILFVRARDQALSSLRFTCETSPGSTACTRLVVKDSKLLANLGATVAGHGAITIDEIETGHFLARAPATIRMRIKRASEPKAHDYVAYQDTAAAPSLRVARWNCPWQASTLDEPTANAACLGTSPLAVPENTAMAKTRIVTPDQCGGDCRAVIQSHLDDPAVRNVVLKGGVFPIAGTVRLSTLDEHAVPTKRTKRLVGVDATIVGKSRYHRIEPRTGGGYDVVDIVPVGDAATKAEVLERDKCREFRAYDDYDKEKRTGYVEYDARLPNRFVALRDRYLADHCGVIETLGNDITVSDLTIDTDELAKIKERRPATPTYDAISLGYFASGWSMPYDMFGAQNPNAAHRVIDTSRSVDERLDLRRLRFVHHPVGAIATYSTPHSIRDTLVEDVRCEAFPSTSGIVSSNCIELDAAPIGNFPFESSYREHIPFSPSPIENFTVRKGPHDDSVCDMTGNDETVRVSGAIGFVVDGCRVQRGFGNAAFFLYVTDTGAKLDATLRNVRVDMEVAKVPPVYRYNPSPIPYVPRRFDAAGKEVFQSHEMKHQGMIQIIGRPVSRSAPFNYRVDLAANDPQLARNKALNEMEVYTGLNYVFRATPSQVFIDGLASVIDAGGDESATDRLYRAHIKEGVGLTGKFTCKDCDFKGGGQIMSADYWDLVGYTAICLNEPAPNGDPSQLTPDEKACTGQSYRVFKTFAPGHTAVLGYDQGGAPMMLLDPNQHFARAHGGWFEFVNVTSSGIHQARAISVIPGALDTNYNGAFRPTPAEVTAFSKIVRAP